MFIPVIHTDGEYETDRKWDTFPRDGDTVGVEGNPVGAGR